MIVVKFWALFTLLSVLFVQFGPCFSMPGGEKCCIKFPRAMDIHKFNKRVATGEDWVEIFFYICPFDAPFAAIEQFRSSINVTNGVLTRVTNFREFPGEPCVGASTSSFDQVGSKTATFRQTGTDGLIREDRYLDTDALDHYYILFGCRDRAGARKGRCLNYFVTMLIRHDPPTNFPWDRAVRDLKRFGIKARDFLYVYVGDVCPVT